MRPNRPFPVLVGLLVGAALAAPSFAADAPDLPPTAAVRRMLDTHPLVRAARSGVDFEAAQRDRLEAGPHEFNARIGSSRRREVPLSRDYREWEVGIERAVRLPGKAARDAELGRAGVDEARFAYGDALHETARGLLAGWFDWLRALAEARDWQAQADVLRRQSEAAGRRAAAGDAPKLEALLAEAALAQAEARLGEANNTVALAADALQRNYPGIALPAEVPAVLPQDIAEPAETWRQRQLEHNHALAAARAASRRQQIAAQRADAERLPDPTLGLRVGNERDGQERIVGVTLTIPLPGAGRAASARAAGAEAGAASAREALALVRAETEAQRTWQQARAAHAQWQRLADAAQRMERNAELLDRAWRLGEGSLSDLLTARRQAIEARLAASRARLDANEARYRLQLDAHELWPLEDGEGPNA